MMTTSDLHPLCDVVQHNCDIADARHAANYTMCVYLLKMREYYRWEKGYAYGEALPGKEVGQWVMHRESLWEDIEHESFNPLEIEGRKHDPFDTEEINRTLLPKGFVYSGGFGFGAVPHFFLAKLEEREDYEGYKVLVAAEECARDLAAPPAMTLGKTIFIRRESLRRMLWEKVQEWQWHRYDNSMGRALQFYPFDDDLELALDQITETETETVILHEIGEVMANEYLGPEWREMVSSLPRSRTEMMARAVKDLLADALSTLPGLIENQSHASMHFYAANLLAMRKELYPSFFAHYQEWCDDHDDHGLKQLVAKSTQHWLATAQLMLDHYRRHDVHRLKDLEQLIGQQRL